MRLYQTWRNDAARHLLKRDVPLVTALVRSKLVDLHTEFFVEASERDGELRRPRLRSFFRASMDVYERALAEGYPEAEAREITHVQAAWEFGNMGWGEILEFPPREREEYFERYRGFFERHGASPEDPLGEFAPPSGLPAAPETPERMAGEFPFAEAGLADGVYVHAPADEVRLRGDGEAGGESGEGTGAADPGGDADRPSAAD
jgi:hypothetical protein